MSCNYCTEYKLVHCRSVICT